MGEGLKIKGEIRILGWDDGPFEARKGSTVLVGVVFRGGSFMDGMLRTDVSVDGEEAEEKIISAIKESKFEDLRVVMLDGITFAGFNTVNIKNIFEETGLPVIVYNRKEPGFEKFKEALSKLPNPGPRLACVDAAGPVHWAHARGKRVCFQCAGIEPDEAAKIIDLSSTHGSIPEPLRIAHIISTALVLGESRGRA